MNAPDSSTRHTIETGARWALRVGAMVVGALLILIAVTIGVTMVGLPIAVPVAVIGLFIFMLGVVPSARPWRPRG